MTTLQSMPAGGFLAGLNNTTNCTLSSDNDGAITNGFSMLSYSNSSQSQQQYSRTAQQQFSPPSNRLVIPASMSSLSQKQTSWQSSSSSQHSNSQFQDQFSENSTCCGSEEDNHPDDYLESMTHTGYVKPLGGMISQYQNPSAFSLKAKQVNAQQLLPQQQSSIQNNKPTVHLEEAKYKTEMCKNWVETNKCNYGEKCKFAHGKHELVQKVAANKHFKTKNCKQFFEIGTCNYGPRCHFLHDTRPANEISQQMFYYKRILNPSAFFDSNRREQTIPRLSCLFNLSATEGM